MRSAYVVEIITPKRFVLDGLWFGPRTAKNVIIFIHGLTGSAFSMSRMVGALVSTDTAVVTFNNRGFEQIAEISRKVGKERRYVRAGGAHEIFKDSPDDIQGAIDAVKKNGAKRIYLAGHSTGCQKAYYWAAGNNGGKAVKGIILFGPLSDYAGAVAEDKKGKLRRSVAYARTLVRAGKPHELMPPELGPWFVCDAQRFLSLYTPDSVEDVFPYAQKREPKLMQKVKAPTLVLLAGADEHGDIPAEKIGDWFAEHLKVGDRIIVVPRVKHSFKGGEGIIAREIRKFMRQS